MYMNIFPLDANVWGTVADWVSGLGTMAAIVVVFYQMNKEKENQVFFNDLDILINKHENIARLSNRVGNGISNEINIKFQPIKSDSIEFKEVMEMYIEYMDLLTQILIDSAVLDILIEKHDFKKVKSFEKTVVRARKKLEEFMLFFENKVDDNYSVEYSESDCEEVARILVDLSQVAANLLVIYKDNLKELNKIK